MCSLITKKEIINTKGSYHMEYERKTVSSEGYTGCRYPSLAMVYGPHQEFADLFDCKNALIKGTIFKDLDKPFYGSGNGGCCR